MTALWDIAPCGPLLFTDVSDVRKHLKTHGDENILMMEAVHTIKTSVYSETTQRYIQRRLSFSYCCSCLWSTTLLHGSLWADDRKRLIHMSSLLSCQKLDTISNRAEMRWLPMREGLDLVISLHSFWHSWGSPVLHGITSTTNLG
jgi:hypothetical protein